MGRPSLSERGLMPAHRNFIKHLLSGKPINRAGQLAGFGRQTGYDLMKNPAIQNELARQMEKVGITDNYLAKKIKQGLNAKTVPQKEGGNRYDDQFVRKQWADLAIKVKGGYAPEKIEAEHKIIQIVIDGNMLQALKDSKAVSDSELEDIETIEQTPIDDQEIIDAEICEEKDGMGEGSGVHGLCREEQSGESLGESDGITEEISIEETGREERTGEDNGNSKQARGEEVRE